MANDLNHYDRVYSRKASRNTCRDTAHWIPAHP